MGIRKLSAKVGGEAGLRKLRETPLSWGQFHTLESNGLAGLGAVIERLRPSAHSGARRSRRALPITETELSAIAAPASMGLSSKPNTGYRTPAATGTPSAL
jgi:hypothetical protein